MEASYQTESTSAAEIAFKVKEGTIILPSNEVKTAFLALAADCPVRIEPEALWDLHLKIHPPVVDETKKANGGGSSQLELLRKVARSLTREQILSFAFTCDKFLVRGLQCTVPALCDLCSFYVNVAQHLKASYSQVSRMYGGFYTHNTIFLQRGNMIPASVSGPKDDERHGQPTRFWKENHIGEKRCVVFEDLLRAKKSKVGPLEVAKPKGSTQRRSKSTVSDGTATVGRRNPVFRIATNSPPPTYNPISPTPASREDESSSDDDPIMALPVQCTQAF